MSVAYCSSTCSSRSAVFGTASSGRRSNQRLLPVRVQASRESSWECSKVFPGKAALTAVLGAAFVWSPPALADLNQYEAAAGGEFNIGSARQYGEADIKGKDFHGEDLRRSNFTSADCRDCNFKDTKLQGAYFIKAVLARANFENADISDMLMDRAVLNDANLKPSSDTANQLLNNDMRAAADSGPSVCFVQERQPAADRVNEEVSFWPFRSDLTGANVEGADFSNALVDKTQQMALCKYASGQNPGTAKAQVFAL